MKVRQEIPFKGSVAERWYFYCPGCYAHRVAQGDTDEDALIRSLHVCSTAKHQFNFDADFPTFSPSILSNFTPGDVCHCYVVGGKIQFLDDCTHPLRGQTVDVLDIPTPDPYYELTKYRLEE
jgi:hypothetical protein